MARPKIPDDLKKRNITATLDQNTISRIEAIVHETDMPRSKVVESLLTIALHLTYGMSYMQILNISKRRGVNITKLKQCVKKSVEEIENSDRLETFII